MKGGCLDFGEYLECPGIFRDFIFLVGSWRKSVMFGSTGGRLTVKS